MKTGKTNNPNGRPKGRPNKTTAQIRELITGFVSKNLDDLQAEYEKLDAEKKLLFFDKILKYVVPTKQQVEVEAKVDPSNQIDYSKLSDAALKEIADA